MTTTVNSDLIIYDDLAQTAYLERRQDNLDVFNASSNGAIVLDNTLIEGDFRKRAFYQLGGTIEHRDVNSTGKVAGKKIGAGESVGVKAPWKYGPYQTTEEAFKRRGRDVSEFSEVVGVDVADATLEGFVKYAIQALSASIGANADMVVSADIETDGKKTLTKGMRKYGDKFGRIALFVMHSATYFDIIDQAIAEKVYEEAGVVVYGGQPGTLGKPVLVTDTAPIDAIFGLLPNAVVITESQAPGFRSYPINDEENLGIGYRAEGTVNIDLLGYSWDTVQGGANPDLTKIGTANSWKKYATSNKVTAGVMIQLTVAPVAVSGVTLDQSTASIAVGANMTLFATVSPEDATNKAVTFASSAPAKATVDPTTGVVTGVATGTTNITVTTTDGSKTAVCAVTVVAA
ncbi:Ig-like domain-containing protein [Sodalis ligni]|uniref:major capsid protein n=1 Tax=Sodalis ligni TaxID=2697027 RepID=UPI00193EE98E|nr:major capsid protein [Sodalis ligni]QWA09528.1 Ig-like domain-containing protein [Sodalis ligni]